MADFFGAIAAGEIGSKRLPLVFPEPIPKNGVILPLHDCKGQSPIPVYKKPDSRAELDMQIENLQDKIYNGKATRADITRVTKRLGDDIAGVYGFSIPKQRQPNEQAR